MKLSTFILCYFIIFCLPGNLLAQEVERDVLSSAGKIQSNSTISMEWTLGEVMIDSYEEGGLVLTQGFHQSDNIITGVAEAYSKSKTIVDIYPNPSQGVLNIQIKDNTTLSSARLYDMLGNLLIHRVYTQHVDKNSISLNAFADGTYLLKLEFDDGNHTSIHKVIKK